MNKKFAMLLPTLLLLSVATGCGATNGKEELRENSAVNNTSAENFKLSEMSGYVDVFTSRGAVKCVYELGYRSSTNLTCDWSSLRTVDEEGNPITQRRNAKALRLSEGWLEIDNTQVWCLDSGGLKECDWSTKGKRSEMEKQAEEANKLS